MKIYCLFHPPEDDLMPWLVAACDEYSVEECAGWPQEYAAKRKDTTLREIVIEIPDKAVTALFKPPLIKGATDEGDPAANRLKDRIRGLWDGGRFLVDFGFNHIDKAIDEWATAERRRGRADEYDKDSK